MAICISNQEFDERVSAVKVTRDKKLGLIDSRLKDLTGLRLAKEPNYQYLHNRNYDEIPIKRCGEKSIVLFPTDKIENKLNTTNQYEVWTFILGRVGAGDVFTKCINFKNRDIGSEADAQLESIREEILQTASTEIGGSVSDILGVFAYQEHLIKLYSQVIAYHSIMHCVEAEDLAFVVLTHELAHAYTMAGYDINGYRGEMLQRYSITEKKAVEGLAQYYTEAVCSQIEYKYHQYKHAFEAMLSTQTYPYTWHKRWLQGTMDHECIRAFLLQYRNKVDSEAFEKKVMI